jgi:hypothetical protein
LPDSRLSNGVHRHERMRGRAQQFDGADRRDERMRFGTSRQIGCERGQHEGARGGWGMRIVDELASVVRVLVEGA